MITPNVVKWAKDHYGCATANGVELEDYGGSGTAGSHWEMRVNLYFVVNTVDSIYGVYDGIH